MQKIYDLQKKDAKVVKLSKVKAQAIATSPPTVDKGWQPGDPNDNGDDTQELDVSQKSQVSFGEQDSAKPIAPTPIRKGEPPNQHLKIF